MKDLTTFVYNFEDLIKGNYLYVDKTEYVWKLIRLSNDGFFCRARAASGSLFSSRR